MSRLPRGLWGYLAEMGMGLLISLALALPALRVLQLMQELNYVLSLLVSFALLFPLIARLNNRLRMLLRLLLLGLILYLAWRQNLVNALEMLVGAAATLQPAGPVFSLYADLLLAMGALLLTLFARLLLQGEAAFSAPMLLSSALMLWFSGARQSVLDFVPAILSLPMLFVYASQGPQLPGPLSQRHQGKALLRAIPIVALFAAVALLLTPAQRSTQPALEKQADRLRQYINDHFFFTSSRENFSLAAQGYQPMGEAGLGGKPQISKAPVMQVETSHKLYLRGTMLDRYSGRQWYDSLSSERYGYTAQRFAGLRDRIMNLSLPEASRRAPLEEASLMIMADLPSTLFTPQRLRGIHLSEGMVPYLNASSEMFITRNLAPGDSYTLRYESYVAGTQQTNQLAAQLAGQPDEGMALLPEAYLQLPRHLEPGGMVDQLAREVIGLEQQPYRQALLLRDYLRENYSYTIDVVIAPEDMDFTQHFLFDTGEGYCTYFATALTVLCRSVGLPSRYVEGFVALPGEDGQASIVTGQQAHAWTEVYIPALGWVTFDATSTTGELPPPPPGQNETPPPDGPEPSPQPEPEDAPSPTQQPEDAPTQQPQPSDQPQPTEAPEPEKGEKLAPPKPMETAWLLWLLLALLLALAIWRLRALQPQRRAKASQDNGQQLLIYWQAYAQCMSAAGLPMQASETIRDYAQRIAAEDQGLQALAEALSAQLYGRRAADRQTVTAAWLYYQAAWQSLPRHRRAALYLRRGWQQQISQLRAALHHALARLRRQG